MKYGKEFCDLWDHWTSWFSYCDKEIPTGEELTDLQQRPGYKGSSRGIAAWGSSEAGSRDREGHRLVRIKDQCVTVRGLVTPSHRQQAGFVKILTPGLLDPETWCDWYTAGNYWPKAFSKRSDEDLHKQEVLCRRLQVVPKAEYFYNSFFLFFFPWSRDPWHLCVGLLQSITMRIP